MNGDNINTQKINEILAIKLKEVLRNLERNDVEQQTLHFSYDSSTVAKCHKCKRRCRSRAVICMNHHRVHYKCEKLSEKEINNLEIQDDSTSYLCSLCRNSIQNKDTLELSSPENKQQLNTTPVQPITKLHIPSEINGISQKQITYTPIIAQQILREENMETCAASSNNLTTHKSTCSAC